MNKIYPNPCHLNKNFQKVKPNNHKKQLKNKIKKRQIYNSMNTKLMLIPMPCTTPSITVTNTPNNICKCMVNRKRKMKLNNYKNNNNFTGTNNNNLPSTLIIVNIANITNNIIINNNKLKILKIINYLLLNKCK